ncbi:MAG: glycosyltransferase family 9 protein [Acidobacteria bacterium]|nr:glycosyltransferase family 9 protein [Acidobacteriota bacterium]
MRFLISRTDALGDVMVSLPVVNRILSRYPSAEVHLLVAPATAPALRGLPGLAEVHLREPEISPRALFERLRPDAVLNLGHRDRAVTVAAREAEVPIRVARARGLDQILAATHLLWAGRTGTGRHEAQNLLEFLHPWGWQGGWPEPARIRLPIPELNEALEEMEALPRPRLGVVLRGSGSGAFPTQAWWDRALPVVASAGWTPVVLAPAGAGDLPATDLRGLMSRIAACDALLTPSTGPAHLAAALGIPTLCLMGKRTHHGPDRWAPLGSRVQVVQYPGPEADLNGGMDRLDPEALLPHLERLR